MRTQETDFLARSEKEFLFCKKNEKEKSEVVTSKKKKLGRGSWFQLPAQGQ